MALSVVTSADFPLSAINAERQASSSLKSVSDNFSRQTYGSLMSSDDILSRNALLNLACILSMVSFHLGMPLAIHED